MTDTVLPILVTGGAGYVGSHACKALAKAGFEPHTFDDLSRGHRGGVKWGPLILGDVRDQQALEQALTETGAVAVLHLAGLSDVGVSVRDPLPYYDVNVGGALALASAMTDTGVDSLIFSSTCAVYGTPEIIPIAESTPLAPINPYGVFKMSAERIFADADADAGAAYGLRTTALRYFNAAGADPDGKIGERHEPERT
jgi:UDP-arabinose 4-epimerase